MELLLREVREKRQLTSISSTANEAANLPSTVDVPQRVFVLLAALRPRQWAKNFVLFVDVVFAQQLFSLPSLVHASVAYAQTCTEKCDRGLECKMCKRLIPMDQL